MSEWVIKFLVIGFVLWLLWSLIRPRYLFEIRIAEGQPRVIKGRVPANFLRCVTSVCQEEGVPRGWIGGVRQGARIALRFSGHFAQGLQQRLRNAWVYIE